MMLAKLLNTQSSRLVLQTVNNRSNRSIRWNSSVQASVFKKIEPNSAKRKVQYTRYVTNFSKKFHQPYENHAPTLFDWSQKIINKTISLDELINSEKFRTVTKALCDTTRHSNKNILNIIKSLIILKLNPEERVMRLMETELTFKLETFDLKLLVQAFNLFYNIKDTNERRQEIVDIIYKQIHERLDRKSFNVYDLLQLLRLRDLFPAELSIKIEDCLMKTLDEQDDTSLENLCYLLVLLSRQNRRNKPLIRLTVNKLLKFRSEEIYSVPPHLIHMICSLNRLNYPEVNLLEKCSDILINSKFLDNVNNSSKRDFLVAISRLNFSYPKLFDYYLQNLIEKPQNFTHQDLITITITLARLNYHNKDMIEVIQSQVLPRCSDPTKFLSKSQWFNFINALTLLNCATVEQLRSVLNSNFLRAMEYEEIENHLSKSKNKGLTGKDKSINQAADVIQTVSSSDDEKEADGGIYLNEEMLSIQNIYYAMNLRRKYLTFCGLVLTQNEQVDGNYKLNELFTSTKELEEFKSFLDHLDFIPFKKSKDLENFTQTIFKSLDSFAPIGKYLRTNVVTSFGFIIDALLTVDLNGNPIALNENNNQDRLLYSNQQANDNSMNNSQKVALMCVGFNDTLLDSNTTLIGPKEAEVRLLKSLGYKVICVHQNSILSFNTSSNLNRVKYLQNLITSNFES